MLAALLTIVFIYAAIGTLIYTNSNSKKYTDYQIRMFLRESNIIHQ